MSEQGIDNSLRMLDVFYSPDVNPVGTTTSWLRAAERSWTVVKNVFNPIILNCQNRHVVMDILLQPGLNP